MEIGRNCENFAMARFVVCEFTGGRGFFEILFALV
jgi:hypothetical protein